MGTLGSYDSGQLYYRDTQWSKQPRGTSPFERLSPAVSGSPVLLNLLYDDCVCNNTSKTTDLWQVIKGTGGSIALGGPGGTNKNGWISIPTAASANDYQAFFTQGAQYALAAGSPIVMEAYLNVTEAATNKASWWIGFTDTTTTGFISNAGAPPASFSGFVVYKTLNAMTLSVMTSNAAAQTTAAAVATAVSAQSLIIGVYADPNDGVTGKVTYWISSVSGGVISLLATGTLNLALAALNPMYLGFGIKAGSAAAETLMMDYIQAYGVRVLV